MNGLTNVHTAIVQGGLLVLLVTFFLFILFAASVTYHWLAFSPAKRDSLLFFLSFYGVSGVLFIVMLLTWSLF